MEGVSLEWSDLDMANATVTFRRTKTSRPRTVRLRPETVAMLRARPRSLATPLVFWHGSGDMYRQFATLFADKVRNTATAEEKAKREFRPFRCHDLRHRFAIEWLKDGGDIYALSKHLGHTSVATTEIYLGHVPAHAAAQTPGTPEALRVKGNRAG